MYRRSLVALALIACSSKHAPPPEQKAPEPKAPAYTPPATLPPGQHLGFIPDSVAIRLGHSKSLAAIDMRAFKVKPFLHLIPEQLACTRDLLQWAGVFAFALSDDGQIRLYATQLSEGGTKQCLETIAAGHTRTTPDGSFEVSDGGGGASLVWDSGVLTVQMLGAPVAPPAPADARLIELVNRVPPGASMFLVGHDIGKLQTVVAWGQVDDKALSVTVHAEASSPEMAKTYVHDVVKGLEDGAREQHYAIDPTWIQESLAGNVATFEAHIPLSVFTKH